MDLTCIPQVHVLPEGDGEAIVGGPVEEVQVVVVDELGRVQDPLRHLQFWNFPLKFELPTLDVVRRTWGMCRTFGFLEAEAALAPEEYRTLLPFRWCSGAFGGLAE